MTRLGAGGGEQVEQVFLGVPHGKERNADLWWAGPARVSAGRSTCLPGMRVAERVSRLRIRHSGSLARPRRPRCVKVMRRRTSVTAPLPVARRGSDRGPAPNPAECATLRLPHPASWPPRDGPSPAGRAGSDRARVRPGVGSALVSGPLDLRLGRTGRARAARPGSGLGRRRFGRPAPTPGRFRSQSTLP